MLLRRLPPAQKKDCRLAILFLYVVAANPKLFFEFLNPDVSVSYGVQVVLQRNGNGRVRQTREAAVGGTVCGLLFDFDVAVDFYAVVYNRDSRIFDNLAVLEHGRVVFDVVRLPFFGGREALTCGGRYL